MGQEMLVIPEEHIKEVTKVLRTGLRHTQVSEEVNEHLIKWCDEQEEYIASTCPQCGEQLKVCQLVNSYQNEIKCCACNHKPLRRI